MAKVKEEFISLESENPEVPRPRLSKLTVKNFRCIGTKPVTIELDDIVVLVGPNNVGKSCILKAYEVVMSHGSAAGKLAIDDFPNSKVDEKALPEVELDTVVYDNTPGQQWIRKDEAGEMYIKERWIWPAPGEPKRQGFNVEKNQWDDHVPWGAPNVAKSRRPQPHRVEAFADPMKQAEEILGILKGFLEDRIKTIKADENTEESNFSKLLKQVSEIQKQILKDSEKEISRIESEISGVIQEVFPGYVIKFDARPEDDLEKSLNLFKAGPQLLMGPQVGYKSTVDRQGSGARRTLLWSALRIISETKASAKDGAQRPHVLLLDEPELCLHPNAIREACRVLYDLPTTGNWQVMLTTHSPAFIDVSRDNTTIVRVERLDDGAIEGITVFRPKRVQLDDDDRRRLKLLNLCDPYVAEFFFGGRSVIVEGDTEFTAFNYVKDQFPNEFKNVHLIRARGKATIISLMKILNHFGAGYSVLHDSDRPTTFTRKTKKEIANPAWTTNENIIAAVKGKSTDIHVRLVASVPNFEEAFFGEEAEDEKPYNALLRLQRDGEAFGQITKLLYALVNHASDLPDGAFDWNDLKTLREIVDDRRA